MTKNFVIAALFVLSSVVAAPSAGADIVPTSRWGDGALSASYGSWEVTFEKRIKKPTFDPTTDPTINLALDPKTEPAFALTCPSCAHYLEARFGRTDVDEIDVTHALLGYRHYAYVKEDVWAAYWGAGMGLYSPDPGETDFGQSLRVGVEVALTKSCSKKNPGTLKSAILGWDTSVTRHWVHQSAGPDVTYTQVLTGLRIVLPSKGDHARVAETDGICPNAKPEKGTSGVDSY